MLCSKLTGRSQQISTLFIPFYCGRLDRHNTLLSRAMLHMVERYHRRVLVLVLSPILRDSPTPALRIVVYYQRCRNTSSNSHYIASKSERITHTISIFLVYSEVDTQKTAQEDKDPT
jgi:hypothetical protein